MAKKIKLVNKLSVANTVVDKVKAVFATEFGEKSWDSAFAMLNHESGFQPEVKNKTSGACGIFQANPCSKLLAVCPTLDVVCQAQWGADYIKRRYGDPEKAWAFWQELHPVMIDGEIKLVHYY